MDVICIDSEPAGCNNVKVYDDPDIICLDEESKTKHFVDKVSDVDVKYVSASPALNKKEIKRVNKTSEVEFIGSSEPPQTKRKRQEIDDVVFVSCEPSVSKARKAFEDVLVVSDEANLQKFTRENSNPGSSKKYAVNELPAVTVASTSVPVSNDQNEKDRAESVRCRRLMKELNAIQKQQSSDPVFTAELVNDNLFEWYVKLYKVESGSQLATSMKKLHVPYILLHLVFPDNFPFKPPFMRVVEPTIAGGYVMEGGAICMELLTPDGWVSTYSIESVITQFAAAVVEGHGKVVKSKKRSPPTLTQAQNAFRSIVNIHSKGRWYTPPKSNG